MPRMNGLEDIKELKKLNEQVKIIVCSAVGQQKIIVEAIHSGASDFIDKPFHPDRVLAALARVIS